MFTYTLPISSFKRLLLNDTSSNIKIVFQIKYNKNKSEVLIEKQKQITINTTINKARVISKIIDEKYINDPTIDSFVFYLNNLNQNEKIKLADFISIFQSILNADENDQNSIPGNKQHIYNLILNALNNENNEIINESNIVKCDYLNKDLFSGIISYIRKTTNDVLDGNSANLILKSAVNDPEFPLSNIIQYQADINRVYLNIKRPYIFEKENT